MTPEKARENAHKVCQVFLRQGRAPEVARRDAEAWALGNHGLAVSLANESQGEDSPAFSDCVESLRKVAEETRRAEKLWSSWSDTATPGNRPSMWHR